MATPKQMAITIQPKVRRTVPVFILSSLNLSLPSAVPPNISSFAAIPLSELPLTCAVVVSGDRHPSSSGDQILSR
jgi:hypothetical protein